VTIDDRNFRLSRDVLPRRVQAALTLDMDARTFAGDAELTLSVERPVRSIVLHAVELDVSQAEVQVAGTVRRARVSVRPVSETVVLDLDADLPAGEARLVLRWTGRFTEGSGGCTWPARSRRRSSRPPMPACLPLLRRAGVQVHLGPHREGARRTSSP
jgi:aminopeptidase N